MANSLHILTELRRLRGALAEPIDTFYAKNKSGGALAKGDVVVYDYADSTPALYAVKSTTSAGDTAIAGMVYEAIAADKVGRIQRKGPTRSLKVNGTTDIAVGDRICSHTVAKVGAKSADGVGAFARALEVYAGDDSNGVIDAILEL